ncbi:hypothetical protein J4Q44_G00037110 [Coregonus suidteri]|uniref:LIM zinc-binding domain-containing protein n=1 Tax=Coregonus suidteri TaxID=861788 RepID=A0AAN8M820_9TELE
MPYPNYSLYRMHHGTVSPPGVRRRLWTATSPSVVKRSGSYDGPHPPSSSPSSPQPPSPSRCVSGKRQCSGCNQALGKGTAMNIDKLGLYFHLTCFKCGVCKGQLGDTSSGTDIRIGNGLLSCHDCYVTSHAAGQPTTL